MSGKTTRTQPLTHLGDRFANLERHGSGGMAEVYKAEQTNMGNRIVALKLLSAATLQDDPKAEERFKREAALSAKLEHDHIITTYDYGVLDGRAYLAFAFIEGESLEDRLEQEKTLDAETTVRLLTPIAEALDYAHRQNIVHRDIKPSNILIRASDQRPILIDFGIGYAAFFSRHLTRKGESYATAEYMSPEQARADDIDGRSDLFSLGVVLYKCLTGDIPFKGSNTEVLIANIKNETPRPVRDRNPSVPKALARVVERCMAKKPEDRYQTGMALAEALRASLTQTTPGASRNLAPWAGALVAVLILAGAVLYAMGLPPFNTAPPVVDVPPESTSTTLSDAGLIPPDTIPDGEESGTAADTSALALVDTLVSPPDDTTTSETPPPRPPPPPPPTSPSIQDLTMNDLLTQARRAYRNDAFARALPLFQEAQRRGSAEAGYYLGMMNEKAQAMPANPSQAIERYRAAAEQGYAAAQHRLGIKYQRGEVVPQNTETAMSWLQKAADQGHTEAQASLASIYESHGKRTSEEKAVRLYEQAGLKGHITAQYKLAEMYKDGRGVARKDPVKAAEWMLRAAEQGDANAQFALGRMYFRAEGVPQSDEKAIEWYGRAAAQGHKQAQGAHQRMTGKQW